MSGVVFKTVTETALDVVALVAASRATAVRVCEGLVAVVVFHRMEYGDVVSSVPRFAPSSLNWTPTTPMLSLAVAESVVVEPETVAPEVGAVSATVGEVVSGVVDVVNVLSALVPVLFAASVESTR